MVNNGTVSTQKAYDYIYGNLQILLYVWFIIIRIIVSTTTLKHTKWPIVNFQDIVLERVTSSDVISVTHKDALLKFEQKDLEKAKLTSDSGQTMVDPAFVLRSEMRAALKNGDLFDAFMQHLLHCCSW